jgi:hypothetical protein
VRTSLTFTGVGEVSMILAADTEAEQRMLACVDGKVASFVVHWQGHESYRNASQVQIVLTNPPLNGSSV